jgi:hypothetical protein
LFWEIFEKNPQNFYRKIVMEFFSKKKIPEFFGQKKALKFLSKLISQYFGKKN